MWLGHKTNVLVLLMSFWYSKSMSYMYPFGSKTKEEADPISKFCDIVVSVILSGMLMHSSVISSGILMHSVVFNDKSAWKLVQLCIFWLSNTIYKISIALQLHNNFVYVYLLCVRVINFFLSHCWVLMFNMYIHVELFFIVLLPWHYLYLIRQ